MTKFNVSSQCDRLTDVILGKSYSPEFYSYIKHPGIRAKMEKIAIETEEDYQQLIRLFDTLNIKYYRPSLSNDWREFESDGQICTPPMTPSDDMIMIGDKFFYDNIDMNAAFVGLQEGYNTNSVWNPIIEAVSAKNHPIQCAEFNSASTVVLPNRLILNRQPGYSHPAILDAMSYLPGYSCRVSSGVSDGSFSLINQSLIVSASDDYDYSDEFPDASVIRMSNIGFEAAATFLEQKHIYGSLLSRTDLDLSLLGFDWYLDLWLTDWMHRDIFDVNMIVVDEKTIIVSCYHHDFFMLLEKHGVKAYITPWRHRWFWYGGLHCITAELNRVPKNI